jgi:hypothetical protein
VTPVSSDAVNQTIDKWNNKRGRVLAKGECSITFKLNLCSMISRICEGLRDGMKAYKARFSRTLMQRGRTTKMQSEQLCLLPHPGSRFMFPPLSNSPCNESHPCDIKFAKRIQSHVKV